MENRNDSLRQGCTPASRQIVATEWSEIFKWRASNRLDQCVTPNFFGGGANVAAITFARSITRGLPERGSSSKPAIPVA